MTVVNRISTAFFEMLLGPLATWPPLFTLVVWSVVVGVLMAVMFRFTSSQKSLKATVDRIRANLLAIKLFQHDLGVTMRCQVALFRAIGLRLWYSFPPLLVMSVPFVLLLAQFGLRFEHRPLVAGEPVVVELRLASEQAWAQYQNVAIEVPSSITVETEALRDEEQRAIYWRLSTQDSEACTLKWQLGEHVIEKRLTAADRKDRLVAVSLLRPGRDLIQQVLHPGEVAYPADSPVESVVVHHDRRATPIFGFDVPWWLTFLIVSCLSAYLVRPLVKVQF